MKFLTLFFVLAVVLCSVYAAQRYTARSVEDTIAAGGQHYHDHGHHGGHHGQGRVQIKTYRGPTQQHGHGWFAPYGFWVRQPHDNPGHGWK